MHTTTVREEAKRLVEQLPDDATWEDLMYKIYVIQSIQAGLKDIEEGKVVSHEEVKRRFGLSI